MRLTLTKVIAKAKSLFVYPFQFGHFSRSSRIDSPLRIDGKKWIHIGDKCLIQKYTWLGVLPNGGGQDGCGLIIGNGVQVGHFNHIYATERVKIEDNVLTADKVYISDNVHEYENITLPVISQPIKQLRHVTVGEGSWIGENVVILGASVGKHCVIGANSVVNKDIPDYSVAVGVPARVIKRYCFETGEWTKTDESGDFV